MCVPTLNRRAERRAQPTRRDQRWRRRRQVLRNRNTSVLNAPVSNSHFVRLISQYVFVHTAKAFGIAFPYEQYPRGLNDNLMTRAYTSKNVHSEWRSIKAKCDWNDKNSLYFCRETRTLKTDGKPARFDQRTTIGCKNEYCDPYAVLFRSAAK